MRRTKATSRKATHSGSEWHQVEKRAGIIEITETIKPRIVVIAWPGDGGDILATLLRNAERDTYTLRIRTRRAAGTKRLAPALPWLPAQDGGPPQLYRWMLSEIELRVTAIGGTIKRLAFPKDASLDEVRRIYKESDTVNVFSYH